MRNPVRDATAGMVTNNMHRHISEEVQEEAEAAATGDTGLQEAQLIALQTVSPTKKQSEEIVVPDRENEDVVGSHEVEQEHQPEEV